MEQSISVLLLGGIIFLLGLYLIANDLPATSSYLAQIVSQGIPAAVGGILLIFGVVGLSTGLVGASRKGNESIDLKVKPSGITVRGGHKISWDSVVSVTSVHHANDAKVRVLWDRADLNYSLDIYVDESLDIPRCKMKNGRPCVRIFLRHYPAVEYMRLYESILDQFERRDIPVVTERTQTQF
ncbi:hypothetical protein [Paeniglutamicibacter psychrophenolicus]|uniref:Transmembrane protein n=2 Tax=Paeniglutamicibacter psychrophenolicus TaxID=257454 RepID=A0ABS4WJ42_9MICC|nr:hypothetical protein [Paeniglutamicibacter psychrophenolicus]MBP2376215.1 hypothetical protein [Paeniglutamicibacter psychrophenolicus]